MAYPVIEGVSESNQTSASTTHAVTLPASIVSTDLVLIIMDIGSTAATVDALTDWTELLDESNANGLKIIYHTGSGVPSAPTFTTSAGTRSAQIAYRISNADKTIAPQIGVTSQATSANPNPPSVTPTGGVSKDYLFIAFFGSQLEAVDDDTWCDVSPTNYTPSPPLQKACGTAGTNLGGMIAAASRQLTTGAAEDPGTFTKDVSAAWRAQTIIVHPAPPHVDPAGLAVPVTFGTPTLTFTGLTFVERLDQAVLTVAGSAGSGDYTSSSFTTAAGTLLVAVVAYDNQGADISAAIPTPTTSGLTWVKKASVYNTGRSNTTHIETWMTDSGAGGSRTIAQAGSGAWDTNTHAVRLWVGEFTGAAVAADQPGATASTTSTTGSARDPGAQSITLSAAPASGSVVLGIAACDCDNANAVTEGAGWSEISEHNGSGSVFIAMQIQFRMGSASTSVAWADLNATGAGTWDYSLLAVEVEAATAANTVTPAGIAQTITFGAPSILFLNPAGLAVPASFGVPALRFQIPTVGLAVTPTFGAARASIPLLPAGHPVQFAFGIPQISSSIAAAGFPLTFAFGGAQLTFNVPAVGFAQPVALGAPTLDFAVALVVTPIGSIFNTANVATYNTTTHGGGPIAASSVNAVVLAVVAATESAGTVPTPTLINHSALPFALLTASVGVNPTTSGLDLLGVWACLATGTASDDVDVDFGGNAQVGCLVSFFEVTGFETTPSSADDIAVQLELAAFGSGTSTSITLDAFADPADVAVLGIGGLVVPAAEDLIPEGGATEIHDLGIGSPNRGLLTTWKANDTTPSGSWTTASAGIALALVLDSTGGGGPFNVEPAGFVVTPTFGSPSVLFVNPVGLAVPATFGVASLSFGGASVTPAGFAVTVTFGTSGLSIPGGSLTPASLAVTATFGTPSLRFRVVAAGLAVPISFGVPALSIRFNVNPASLVQPVGFGVPQLRTRIIPAGLSVPIVLGSPTLTIPGATLFPAGVPVVVTFGVTALTVPVLVQPAGFDVEVLFGAVTVTGFDRVDFYCYVPFSRGSPVMRATAFARHGPPCD